MPCAVEVSHDISYNDSPTLEVIDATSDLLSFLGPRACTLFPAAVRVRDTSRHPG